MPWRWVIAFLAPFVTRIGTLGKGKEKNRTAYVDMHDNGGLHSQKQWGLLFQGGGGLTLPPRVVRFFPALSETLQDLLSLMVLSRQVMDVKLPQDAQ